MRQSTKNLRLIRPGLPTNSEYTACQWEKKMGILRWFSPVYLCFILYLFVYFHFIARRNKRVPRNIEPLIGYRESIDCIDSLFPARRSNRQRMLRINQIHVTLLFPKSRFHSRSLSSWVDVRFTFSEKTISAYMSTSVSHLRVLYFVCHIVISRIAISSHVSPSIQLQLSQKGSASSEWKITREKRCGTKHGSARIRSSLHWDTTSRQEDFSRRYANTPSFARRSVDCFKGVRIHRVIISARWEIAVFDLRTEVAVSP